ncbi:outer membrane protein [Thermodesulfovibrio aggregans]|uniref:Outer membrane protein n=1 Tax=Thermodesulfovibrio aggregans TaxID=86166 RepID=A0A0U9I9I0_9BACT|nr:TolC family protein [Thermodesulfovibrio aggregans]GAQ94598.1 outer membrane protein [Thermodesulfovibrio aggregans]
MKIKILIFLIFFFVAQQSFAQQNLTISDVFSLALKKAEKIRIAEENITISKEGKYKALAGLLPTLTAFGKYTDYYNEKIVNNQIIQPDKSMLWGVTLEEKLSLGGKEFINYAISGQNLTKTEFDVTSFKEQYLLRVAQDLYGYLIAKRAVEIAESNVERLKKHRDAAKIRLKVGEVTKTDLLRAEAELSGAEAELIAAKNNLKVAKAVLARDAGIEGDFEIIENKLRDPYLNLTVDHVKALAKELRPEIRAASISKDIAKKNVDYAIGSFFPYLSLSATYQKLDQSPSNQMTNKESKYAIASINFPIFEGGLRRAEVSEAKAKLRQAELQYEDTVKEVFIDVESAYHNYITFRDTIKSLEDEVAFARDNFNSVFKQYQFGLASSLDVTDANTFLVTAERKLMEAQYNYQLAILRLRQSTGTLLKAFRDNEIVAQETDK